MFPTVEGVTLVTLQLAEGPEAKVADTVVPAGNGKLWLSKLRSVTSKPAVDKLVKFAPLMGSGCVDELRTMTC